MSWVLAAEKVPGAGGAPVSDMIISGLIVGTVVTVVLALGLAREGGRLATLLPLQRWGKRSILGLPAWAAVPLGVIAVGLPLSWTGIYWDVTIHADNGRDPGILPNAGHWFVLGGVLICFAGGWLSIVMSQAPYSPGALKIGDWRAPVGGLIEIVMGSIVLTGLPADDIWHRFFGQDVTFWSPTHLVLVVGNATAVTGAVVLYFEGRAAVGSAARLRGAFNPRVAVPVLFGALLVGFSIFQVEWDIGMPQFRLMYQPALIAAFAALVLVAARTVGGRGTALGVVAVFLAIRTLLELYVGVALGHVDVMFPLYIAEALIVEVVALALGTVRTQRFALVSAALIGTVGVLAEAAWSRVWMPLEWPADALPEGILAALVAGVGGALAGAYYAGALTQRRSLVSGLRGAGAGLAGFALFALVMGVLSVKDVPEGARAQVTITEARPAPQREVNATVRFTPRDVAEDATFLVGASWQGGPATEVTPLKRVAEGVYRTTEPLRVYGHGKASIRLNRGNVFTSLPVFLPDDPAIPAREVPASARFERPLGDDGLIMLREQRRDIPSWTLQVGYGLALLLLAGIIVLVGALMGRLGRSARREDGSRDPRLAPPVRAAEREAVGAR